MKLLKNNFELIFWLMAIVALGVTNPGSDSHFVLCPLRLMGITWCPGCGIGHAISYLIHGDIGNSLKAHWLGIPALFVTFYRIWSLICIQIFKFKELKTYSHE
ncbi:DUF2752 domain-containing protein [Mucilaginibacter ginkgonis]|uniref:DUF2752 domain-containing protein n=1 Tax=Mucilaginibacter ginkgonis TaxID=2682091 RepID=A0A6I4HZB0_9SPHI|nr:DUF2752 domain-containing protein [Mucilaginibacter ginkgonis]